MGDQAAKLMIVGFLGLVLIVVGVGWLSAQGTTLQHGECRWDAEAELYTVSLRVSNAEDAYKVVHATVQGRFRPPRGRRWPYPMLRTQYEAITKEMDLLLKPHESVTQSAAFSIPAVAGFLCTVHTKIAGQERLGTHPSAEVLNAFE